MQIFQQIGEFIEYALNIISNASLNEKFIQLQSLMSLLLVLSIMYKGYQTIAGRNQDPIRDIIWDIARKMFILTFILNVNGWLNLSIDALKGLYEWAGGGMEFYTQLDTLTDEFIKAVSKYWNSVSGLSFKIVFCVFVIFFLFLSFLAVIIPFAFMIINASITNTLLIISLPLALFCFMYEATRQAFNQWLNMFISNIFLLLFMGTITDFFIENYSKIYNFGEGENEFIIIVKCMFWSSVMITIIQVIKTLASNLAQVSLDSAASSGMGRAMGMIGSSSKLAWGGTKGVTNNALKASIGAKSGEFLKAGAKGGLAGLAGYGAKKVVKSLFSSARNKQ